MVLLWKFDGFRSFRSNVKEWHPHRFFFLRFPKGHTMPFSNYSVLIFMGLSVDGINLQPPPRPSDWFRAKYSEWNKMLNMWLLGCDIICIYLLCFFGEEVDGDSVIIIPLVCSYVLGTDILVFCFVTVFHPGGLNDIESFSHHSNFDTEEKETRRVQGRKFGDSGLCLVNSYILTVDRLKWPKNDATWPKKDAGWTGLRYQKMS